MALADSTHAVGAVSRLLKARLAAPRTQAAAVSIGRPEAAIAQGGPKFNLFLYQVQFDGHMRNHPLDEGQPAPLWLVLHYLLTAIDDSRDSDSDLAHDLLGEGLLALQELNFLHPDSPELLGNPEPLKITFDSADAELLSKLMQGTDERYRVSAAFQVRPVMIAPSKEPSYAPLVRFVGPPDDQGVSVLPSLGPRLDRVEPARLQSGETLTLKGLDFNQYFSEVRVGNVALPVSAVGSEGLQVTIPQNTPLSAGAHLVQAVRALPGGRSITSNALLVHLLPVLESADARNLAGSGRRRHGSVELKGRQLGGESDSIFVAFFRNGAVQLMLECRGSAEQTQLNAVVPPEQALERGKYRIILRVNGEQAVNSPEVNWS